MQRKTTPYVRSRTKGGLEDSLKVNQLVRNESCAASGAWHQYGSGPTPCGLRVGEYRAMTDMVDPAWLSKRRKGILTFNAMVSSHVVCQTFDGPYQIENIVNKSCASPIKYTGWLEEGPVFAKFWVSNFGQPSLGLEKISWERNTLNDLIGETWTKCLASRQNQGSTNYMESLAELDKAFAMLANPLENVGKFLKGWNNAKKNRRKYKRVIKKGQTVLAVSSSEWLRFRYGIKPLMSDVKEGLEALVSAFDGFENNYTARATGYMERYQVYTGENTYDQIWLKWQDTLRHYVKIMCMSVDSYKKSVWDHLGLNMTNAIGLGWELTHFSFVVDWFANVGDLIYANIPRVNITHKGGCMVIDDRVDRVISPTGFRYIATNPQLYNCSSAPGGLVSYKFYTKSRGDTVHGSSLVIKHDFRLDHWIRATDAIALIMQQLRRVRV